MVILSFIQGLIWAGGKEKDLGQIKDELFGAWAELFRRLQRPEGLGDMRSGSNRFFQG